MAFERVIVNAEKRRDYIVLASALNNAAVAYTDLRQLSRATSYYAKAIALYDELHRATEAARSKKQRGTGAYVARLVLSASHARTRSRPEPGLPRSWFDRAHHERGRDVALSPSSGPRGRAASRRCRA